MQSAKSSVKDESVERAPSERARLRGEVDELAAALYAEQKAFAIMVNEMPADVWP